MDESLGDRMNGGVHAWMGVWLGVRIAWPGLAWPGLAWLGWAGLGWAGLGWAGLDWNGMGWVVGCIEDSTHSPDGESSKPQRERDPKHFLS